MTKKTDWMSIRIPEGLRQSLKKEAETSHRSLASHIVYILETHLKKSAKKC